VAYFHPEIFNEITTGSTVTSAVHPRQRVCSVEEDEYVGSTVSFMYSRTLLNKYLLG